MIEPTSLERQKKNYPETSEEGLQGQLTAAPRKVRCLSIKSTALNGRQTTKVTKAFVSIRSQPNSGLAELVLLGIFLGQHLSKLETNIGCESIFQALDWRQ